MTARTESESSSTIDHLLDARRLVILDVFRELAQLLRDRRYGGLGNGGLENEFYMKN